MLLTIDIGNTSITLGLFDGNALVDEYRLASDKELPIDEYEVLFKTLFKNIKISGCIIGSVVEELNDKIRQTIINVFGIEPLFLTSEIKTKIKINMPNPKEVGADRIANACGAYMLYNMPVIVIDFGTATSFDIVNQNCEFIGGVIAPGLNLQLKSLNKFTSKLPRIEAVNSPSAIGKNTVDAILSGVVRGSACMIDGLVEQCEAELRSAGNFDGKVTVVATGGYATLIAPYLKRQFDFINPTLTLEGLRYLYNLNQ